ncbi:hypothetical protein SKAU_G00219830 [Synaphobranchus kaupii]|uniref:Uncharacterized protein n=1 Tax=Synaphobranchus kaupii TaxID=118154 RepID=A0A9Q1FAJ7_SYNKA|nr:hypothetical protein SKAU_G00219830 [Synaphobranchus kaupii]
MTDRLCSRQALPAGDRLLLPQPHLSCNLSALITGDGSAGAEGTRPWSLVSQLIFHFIAHLSISNGANGSICMTGFVTGRIRCQTRLNITPERYHNQASNEHGPGEGQDGRELPPRCIPRGGGRGEKKEAALPRSDGRPPSVDGPGLAVPQPQRATDTHGIERTPRITGDTENR